jgi:hypothetical protein
MHDVKVLDVKVHDVKVHDVKAVPMLFELL